MRALIQEWVRKQENRKLIYQLWLSYHIDILISGMLHNDTSVVLIGLENEQQC